MDGMYTSHYSGGSPQQAGQPKQEAAQEPQESRFTLITAFVLLAQWAVFGIASFAGFLEMVAFQSGANFWQQPTGHNPFFLTVSVLFLICTGLFVAMCFWRCRKEIPQNCKILMLLSACLGGLYFALQLFCLTRPPFLLKVLPPSLYGIPYMRVSGEMWALFSGLLLIFLMWIPFGISVFLEKRKKNLIAGVGAALSVLFSLAGVAVTVASVSISMGMFSSLYRYSDALLGVLIVWAILFYGVYLLHGVASFVMMAGLSMKKGVAAGQKPAAVFTVASPGGWNAPQTTPPADQVGTWRTLGVAVGQTAPPVWTPPVPDIQTPMTPEPQPVPQPQEVPPVQPRPTPSYTGASVSPVQSQERPQPKFCSSCGSALQRDAKFCTVCGARIQR